MPLTPANALTRVLRRDEYGPNDMPAPPPGTVQKSAATATELQPSGLATEYVPNSKPHAYKLSSVTVNVEFVTAESWFADYVATWPQANQDALLAHEQLHYLITALSGRDFVDDIEKLRARTYPSTDAAKVDIQAVVERYSKPKLKEIHDKYDADTHHDPVGFAAEQAKWKKTLEAARTFKTNLRDTLTKAAMLP